MRSSRTSQAFRLDGWPRLIAIALLVVLAAVVGAPFEVDWSLPGGSVHRVTRGGPRLELGDVFVHDVDLAPAPGDQRGDGDSRPHLAVNPRGRRAASAPTRPGGMSLVATAVASGDLGATGLAAAPIVAPPREPSLRSLPGRAPPRA